MSNTFVPFNFAPKAQQIVSSGGNYVIPANEFALVSIFYNITTTQADLTLNGTTVFKSPYLQAVNQTTGAGGAPISGTAPADGFGFVAGYNDNFIAGYFPQQTTGIAGAPIGPSVGYGINSGGAVGAALKGFFMRQFNSSAPSQFWAKAGDTIAIAGGDCRVVIHRYDVPS